MELLSPSDKAHEDEHPKEGDKQSLVILLAALSGVMDQVWRFNVDYNRKVSDPATLHDFDSKYGSRHRRLPNAEVQLPAVAYANFDVTVSTKQFRCL